LLKLALENRFDKTLFPVKNITSKTLLHIFLVISILFTTTALSAQTNLTPSDSKETLLQNHLHQTYFVKNTGQFADVNGNNTNEILYKSEAAGTNVYIRKQGFTYVNFSDEKNSNTSETNAFDQDEKKSSFINLQRIDVDFLNSNTEPIIEEGIPMAGYFNYYLSHCKNGINNITGSEKLTVKNIYNNIDLIYHGGKTNGLKYDIVVKSGGDLNKIAMKYSGCEKLELNEGALKISSSIGNDITEYIPKVYQVIAGKIKEIKTEYTLDHDNTIRFKMEYYNKAYDLIIDPWATYFGGPSKDCGLGITNDPNNGSVFITGYSRSIGLPVTPGVYQIACAGLDDAFIAKFDVDGVFQWATYFGGGGTDNGDGIAADALGNVIITGYTKSGLASPLPITTGAFQTRLSSAGLEDAFLAKFNTSGNLVWSTYYGGTGDDHGYAIAVQNNDIVFTGSTKSNGTFPVNPGCFQGTFGGGTSDAFLIKFGAAGNRIFGTYFGGTGNDVGYGINTNSSNIVIAGETSGTLPGPSVPSLLNAVGISRNAFISKFNSTGTPVWSTVQGGSNIDMFKGPAFDSNNNIIVAGLAYSNNFPVLNGSQMLFGGGATDAVVVKFDPNGTTLWSTFFGGTMEEEGFDIEIDAYDNIIVAGDTYSDTSVLFKASTCAPIKKRTATENQYISKYYPNGTVICMGYVGGGGHNDLFRAGMMSFYNGKINIVISAADNYPTTVGAYDRTYNGGPISAASPSLNWIDEDAAVVQMCANVCGVTKPPVDFVASQTTVCRGQVIDFTDITNICDTSGATYNWSFQGANTTTSTVHNPTGILYNTSGIYPVKLVIHSMCGDDSLIKNSYITVNGPDITINNFKGGSIN